MAQVLLVEDHPEEREALKKLIEIEGFGVREATSLREARAALSQAAPDLLLADLQLADGSALELLPELEALAPLDVVFITGHASVDSAVAAFRGGVVDYLTKPLEVDRLRKILANVRRAARLQRQVEALRSELRELGRFGRLVGASPPMQAVYDQIQKVAPTEATVLLSGETGTGKEVVARTIHELSSRAEGAFLPLNCGAISSSLIESELFGHERGSFTGAVARHEGVFERANRGTLFLDEVAEMPLDLQVKLLRALECGEIQRVGGTKPVKVDVRVIAATNRDPRDAVAKDLLREDLFYRLAVFPIELPPLRARGEDVLLLAEHVLAELNRRARTSKILTSGARDALRVHAWPGNVRELNHVVERAFILAGERIGADSLALGPHAGRGPEEEDRLDIRVGMASHEAERILTLATLRRYGEKKRTAEVLGISLKTLYNRIQRYKTRHEEEPELEGPGERLTSRSPSASGAQGAPRREARPDGGRGGRFRARSGCGS